MSAVRQMMVVAFVALAVGVAAPHGRADAGAGKNQIDAVDYLETDGVTTLRIRGSATPTFTVYKLERPTRVVVDVAKATIDGDLIEAGETSGTIAINSWAVGQVAVQRMDGSSSIVRVMVTLARPGSYKVKADGEDVVVVVTARDAPPPAPVADDAASKKALDEAVKLRKAAEAAQAEAVRAKVAAEAQVGEARRTAELEADKARKAAEAAEAAAVAAKKKSDAETAAARKAASLAEADAKKAKDEAKKATAAAEAAAGRARSAQADADRAKHDARAEAEQTKKQAQAEADAARAQASKAQAEATRAQAEADAARADAERVRKQATADAERIRRDAETEAARGRAAVAAAQADADRIKTEADRAKATAERESRAAAAARARADEDARKAVADAQAEARRATSAAEAQVREATARMREAEQVMKSASGRLAEAERVKREAAATQRAADEARTQAAKREQTAQAAEERAASERREATAAAKQAARVREEAEAARGDSSKVAALRKKAEEAARAAEARQAKAEEAVRLAEQRRGEAEKSAEAALTRQRDAVAMTASAEQEHQAAVRERAAAEAHRGEAERAAADAGQRAERATKLRVAEEHALAEAASARADAERRRASAEQAATSLEASVRAAKQAETAAGERRRAAEAAERRAADARSHQASDKEIAQARAEADKLDRERRAAEAAVAERRREVSEREAAVTELGAERDRAAAELARLKQAADQARAVREREEQALAAVSAKRSAAEQALAVAERAAAAQAKNSKAAKVADVADARPAAKPEPVRAARVRDVDFVDREGAARVVIDLSSPAEPKVLANRGKQAVLAIRGAAIAEKLERTLDTTRFRGPVRAVSSYRDPEDPDVVRIVVDLAAPTRAELSHVGNTWHWDFAKPDAGHARAPDANDVDDLDDLERVAAASDEADKAANRAAKKAGRGGTRTESIPGQVVGGYGATSTPITQKTVAQGRTGSRKVYRGTQIDLDFKDADIHNLLRLLADVGGVNIVVPDEIRATVTVRMRRVPWDQALEVILASKGLWYRREGNLYRVAPRKQLDAEDQAEQERLLSLVAAEAPEPEVFTLNYAVATGLKQQLAPLLSPKGKIEVDKRTNSLIINDIKAHRRRIIDLVTRLDTQTPQIQIESRIVEAGSTFLREMGIQWGGRANAASDAGNGTGLIFPSSASIAGGADDGDTNTTGTATPSDFAVNMPAAVGTGSGGAIGVALGSLGGNFNLNLRLSALEDTGTARIISAPKITVVNNERAEIKQGVSIPFETSSSLGTTTTFVDATLSLEVTPHVSQRDCSISMELVITKNDPDFSFDPPAIRKKEARTTILVADGETTVMGGIYTRTTSASYSKVPFFADLPVIGWFFKSRREIDDRSELLVFITPKITNRASLRCE